MVLTAADPNRLPEKMVSKSMLEEFAAANATLVTPMTTAATEAVRASCPSVYLNGSAVADSGSWLYGELLRFEVRMRA